MISSRLINVCFTNQYHFCWYKQKLKSRKVASLFFFQVNFLLKQPFSDFFKVGVLKSYAIFAGKHLRWSYFWIKFQSFRPATLKITPTKVLFCEYCKIFKNSFFFPAIFQSENTKWHPNKPFISWKYSKIFKITNINTTGCPIKPNPPFNKKE